MPVVARRFSFAGAVIGVNSIVGLCALAIPAGNASVKPTFGMQKHGLHDTKMRNASTVTASANERSTPVFIKK